MRHAIHSPFIGHAIAEELNAADDLDSRLVPFEQSIYRDLGIFDAVSVHLKDLSAVVRVGDDLVGVDKIGHFLVEGWAYFDRAYLQGKGIEAALDWGEHTERTYFGLYTTGIYSAADLATDFDGMRFWLRLLGQARDPLDDGYFANRPYVTCARRFFFGRRRWRVSRRVDLGDYVNGAWDEGQNCSRFRTPEIERRVAARIAERGEADGRDYTCPIDAAVCADAREHYGRFAKRLLAPRCLAAERPPRPWWKPW